MSELEFFGALLYQRDSSALRLVDRDRDLSGGGQQLYDWIVQFRQENDGKLPDPLTVAGRLSAPLPRPPESPEYYARLIQQSAKRATLERHLSEDVVPHLEGHDPDLALTATAEALSKVRSAFPVDDDHAYLSGLGANIDERIADYEARATSGGQLGLPLPWASMGRMTLGFQHGELWSLIARPNIGKTWAAIVIAVYLWQAGYRVLFASMETAPQSRLPRTRAGRQKLSKKELIRRQRLTVRFDAVGARISAWRFLTGCCNQQEWGQFLHYAECCRNQAANGWGELSIVSTPRVRTLGQLEQEAREFEPDLIVWDSAFLAIPRRTKGGTGKRTDLAGYFLEDCKAMAERLCVPTLLTWHFNREVKEGDVNASMNDIALTDDMGRLVDVIMYLFRTPEMADAGEALWRSGKIRDGVGIAELRTRFEVKREMRFEEIAFGAPERGQ